MGRKIIKIIQRKKRFDFIKNEKHRKTNIIFLDIPLLFENKLEKQFDIIESSGVLHHMDNPLEGWKVLVNKLCSGGVMKIGLYSDIARQDVVKAREYIAKRKYKASQNDIRKFRKEIIDMKSNFNSKIFFLFIII